MTILFITQKIHKNDDDLAFVILWIKEFIRQGVQVQVICLEKGNFDDSFPVHSLGKESGKGKIFRTIRFLKLIFTLRYDRVFVHMNPEYVTLGGWYWFLRRKPIYLWYTHYTMHIHLWLSGLLCKRMFAATRQSLPQFEGNAKKIVTGHGIDLEFWSNLNKANDLSVSEKNIVSIHRICRSKRLELGIQALKYLPSDYNLSVYGRDVEKDYYSELQKMVSSDPAITARVKFNGPQTGDELRNIYPKYRLMVNMASETIDKTMLEAMVHGVYPITTPGNSQAIGLPIWPKSDMPVDIAEFILKGEWRQCDRNYLYDIVAKRHSLKALVGKMLDYIKAGK